MIVAGIYSFNGGKEAIETHYGAELREVEQVIAAVNSQEHQTKTSREKTMPGRQLYSPASLNRAFKQEFTRRGWHNRRIQCDYPTAYYTAAYTPIAQTSGGFRDIDFVKGRVGVEIQSGKYAFMVYNVCAKMTIFNKLGVIEAGIEVVPVKEFAAEMSTGVSYFEQFVWDLEQRGVSNIDIPVLILGLAA